MSTGRLVAGVGINRFLARARSAFGDLGLSEVEHPLAVGEVGLGDPQWAFDRRQELGKSIEVDPRFVDRSRDECRIRLRWEPQAQEGVLSLDVEKGQALDVNQHRLMIVAQKDMVRSELAMDQPVLATWLDADVFRTQQVIGAQTNRRNSRVAPRDGGQMTLGADEHDTAGSLQHSQPGHCNVSDRACATKTVSATTSTPPGGADLAEHRRSCDDEAHVSVASRLGWNALCLEVDRSPRRPA